MTGSKHPSVVVLAGAEAGTVLQIDEVLNDFVLGSADGCHLVLSGSQVSPMHAALFLDDEGQVVVTDTRSLGGVFVNGTRVTERLLADGDQISIGPPDDPASPRLRFIARGAELAEGGVSGLVPEPQDLAGIEELPSTFPEDLGLVSLEAPPLPVLDLFQAPEDLAPAPIADFTPQEMPGDVPESVPEAPAELQTDPSLVSEPLAEAHPEFEPAPVPQESASLPSKKGRPASRVQKPIEAGNPLAGLAEALGGGDSEGSVAPSLDPSPQPSGADSPKPGPSILVRVARVGAVAALLAALTWIGLQKYAQSITVPVVDTYVPNPVEPGQTLTINGSGFGTDLDPGTVKVKLGSVEAQVLDAISTRLNVSVPESLGPSGSQTLFLTVEAQGETSTSRLLDVAVIPKITELTPRVALTGDEVAITGKWLASEKTRPAVTVAGRDAELLEVTPTRIRIRIPSVLATEGQRVSVRVALGTEKGKDALLYYGRIPFVEAVSPERALPGEVVTLNGLGLSGPDLSVTVGSRPAAVLSATAAEVRISVPGLRLSERAGARSLVVAANGKTSVPYSLDVLRESSSLYSPRFFVELSEGSRFAVSCELGPVMVLGTDGPSRQRAHDAAARLNALARDGRTRRVQFTVSDQTINAPGGKVLSVVSGDGSGNAYALAGLWAAHLNDMFDLFLQGRRPGRAVERSPDGRALLDIFAAARRRSGAPGVPQAVLLSPDPAWMRSLNNLAAAPTFSSDQVLALADGSWAGLIEVPGAIQPRRVEIRLTVTPSGLAGQSTSRQGGLSSYVNLRDLSFVRRELRFTFTESGEDLAFKGQLDGDAIDGAVTKLSGAPLGKLTLKLAP